MESPKCQTSVILIVHEQGFVAVWVSSADRKRPSTAWAESLSLTPWEETDAARPEAYLPGAMSMFGEQNRSLAPLAPARDKH